MGPVSSVLLYFEQLAHYHSVLSSAIIQPTRLRGPVVPRLAATSKSRARQISSSFAAASPAMKYSEPIFSGRLVYSRSVSRRQAINSAVLPCARRSCCCPVQGEPLAPAFLVSASSANPQIDFGPLDHDPVRLIASVSLAPR